MATPSLTEYVEVAGLPLDTPAWEHINPEALYATGDVNGDGIPVAYHDGERPSVGWHGPRRVDVILDVRGERDSDDAAQPSILAGIRRNLDELKKALRPRKTGDGTVLLHHYLDDDDDRSADCQVIGPVQITNRGGVLVRAAVPLWLPAGLMRNVTPTVVSGSGSAAFDLDVVNPGSADQFAAAITLSGTATSVEITSAAFGGVSLTFGSTVATETVIDTGEFTALRDAADVHGLVTVSGFGRTRWLPIPVGGAVWTVTPTGGSVTAEVSHRAPWE